MPSSHETGTDETSSHETGTDDHVLAARIAGRAGALLLEVRAEAGGETASLGAEGDRRAHELIMAALRQARPDDAVLSEEAVQSVVSTEHGRRRVWIVDPLDGTREFSEGRSDFAVHVALVENGVPTVGAVALPGEGLVLSTAEPPTAPAPHRGRIRILVSRTRPPAEVATVAAKLDAELVPMGSAGAKTMAVVRGEGEIYLHSGGQYEWDSAAPVAVARAAGLHASRLDGSPLVYDRPDPWLPDLLVCRAEVVDQVLCALGAAT
ncbi:MAG TPA: 3'(2'),5'-bisphosphate nucleotidase CysQ [Acidimicrobiales bacterium]|nr:3'(2'),5'-bisphosphate nucleotidase CysQ [Acidimicrobiales bacterium]